LSVDNLIKTFCLRFSDIIEYLETCEIDSADGNVDVLPVVKDLVDGYMVSLVYSRGIQYHADIGYATTNGVRHCHMFVLRNPGYVFKRKLSRRQIEAHEKSFFSFDLTKSHGLFWNRGYVPKRKRQNWIGLAIDSYRVLDERKCYAIMRKITSMSFDHFMCKRWFFNRMQIGGCSDEKLA
jgi:hypothetical protein